jgi:hypothetical protein
MALSRHSHVSSALAKASMGIADAYVVLMAEKMSQLTKSDSQRLLLLQLETGEGLRKVASRPA